MSALQRYVHGQLIWTAGFHSFTEDALQAGGLDEERSYQVRA